MLLDEFQIKNFLVWVESLYKEGVIVDRDRLAKILKEIGWWSMDAPVNPRVKLLIRKKRKHSHARHGILDWPILLSHCWPLLYEAWYFLSAFLDLALSPWSSTYWLSTRCAWGLPKPKQFSFSIDKRLLFVSSIFQKSKLFKASRFFVLNI